jgi:hypothetical protein
LPQVYGIIKQHGGTIDKQSKRHRHRATIYLPALAEPNSSAHLQKLPDKLDSARLCCSSKMTINLPGTENPSGDTEHQVLTASDRLEALRCYDAASDTIVMVISDLVMPTWAVSTFTMRFSSVGLK